MNNLINLQQTISCSSNNCFDNNFFINSLSSDIAHVSYCGLGMEQNPHIIYPFNELISKLQPSRIIEIGTFAGGLTLILKNIIDSNKLNHTNIYTYDVNEPTYLKNILNTNNNINNIESYTTNIFTNSYDALVNNEHSDKLINLIQSPGITLLLCDGGCKRCEFNILSKYLKANDIIMAHDYCPNIDYFEQNMKNKQWNWCEIEDSYIKDAIDNNNLQKFMYEEFLSVGWLCMKKL